MSPLLRLVQLVRLLSVLPVLLDCSQRPVQQLSVNTASTAACWVSVPSVALLLMRCLQQLGQAWVLQPTSPATSRMGHWQHSDTMLAL